MTIVVTGATGHLGRLIVESLLARGVPAEQLVAIGRQVGKISDLAARGVAVRKVDYDDQSALDSGLSGADIVVLVSGSEMGHRVAQHIAVIESAKRAGATRLIYTSVPDARRSALTMVAADHKATEEYLESSGLTFTILRNGFYHEIYLETAARAVASGSFVGSAGDGRVASVARADLAEAAAVAATTEGHENAVYELAGATSWGFEEFAANLSSVAGKPIRYVSVSSEEHAAALAARGVDDMSAGFELGLDTSIRNGLLSETSDHLTNLLGRPPVSFADTITQGLTR